MRLDTLVSVIEVSNRQHGRLPTSDLRNAVTGLVRDTGPPPAGHGTPFIRTGNCRPGNGGRNSRIFRFFFLW